MLKRRGSAVRLRGPGGGARAWDLIFYRPGLQLWQPGRHRANSA